MDWTPFAPPAEVQHSNQADSMGCASFSAVHCIESQELTMYGKTNEYSERALAKLSGTTHNGNSVMNVVNAIKKYGLVLEKDWPTTGNWTWDDFYADIPKAILDKAVKVDVDLVASVDSNIAPLWTEIQIGGNILHMVEQLTDTTYFDSYEQYIKSYDSSHVVLWQGLLVLKGTPMNEAVVVKSKTSDQVYICYKAPDMDWLQKTCNIEAINLPAVIPDSDTL